MIVLSAHVDAKFQIHLLRVGVDGTVSLIRSFDVEGDVTCLSLSRVCGFDCILAGILGDDGKPSLTIIPTDESQSTGPRKIPLESSE